MKQNTYRLDNYVEKLIKGENTFFLDAKELKEIKSKLKKVKYQIYVPYKDSEKVILYVDKIPDITLFKIKSHKKLKHQEILGSILGLNILPNYLGDIIIDNDNYYFYIMSDLKNFIKENLTLIGKTKVSLKEIDLKDLENYERKYEEYNIVVSSLRIDTVIAKIIKTNRNNVISKIKNNDIILNYEILNKGTYILKENDIFSIRRCGKYKYLGIIKDTKKGNIVIKYLKYI